MTSALQNGRIRGSDKAPQHRVNGLGHGTEGITSMQEKRTRKRGFGFDAYDEVDHGYKTPCWIYRKKPTTTGYAQFCMPDGTQPGAHRAFYEHYVGPIPEGLTIDHLCRVRRCVNPAHLEPVTPRVNVLRGNTVTAANAHKTHCYRGHAFDDVNTYVDKRGLRLCRACWDIDRREKRWKS